MSQTPTVLLIADPLGHKEFRKLARPKTLNIVSRCEVAPQIIETIAPELILIDINSQVIRQAMRALREDTLHFADHIHNQSVGDIGGLLKWLKAYRRICTRPMNVGLFSNGFGSMVPPLILRLMGCDYIVSESELREAFQSTIASLISLPRGSYNLTNQIFISYVRADENHAKALYQRLSDLQLNPWMDTGHLAPGTVWSAHIEEAIRKSTFFLPLLSRHAIHSKGFFQQEIQIALDMWLRHKGWDDTYIIPVLLEEGIDYHNIPISLQRFHWINIAEKTSLTRLLLTFLRTIQKQLPLGQEEPILIIGNDQGMGGLYKNILCSHNYHPILCEDPDKVIYTFQDPPFLVVILDFMGEESMKVLQKPILCHPKTKIILTTTFGESGPTSLPFDIFCSFTQGPQIAEDIILHVHEALKSLGLR